MKIIGDKKIFEIAYEMRDEKYGILRMYVDNVSVYSFYNSNTNEYRDIMCNIKDLIDWLKENLNYIIHEDDYPFRYDNEKSGKDFLEFFDKKLDEIDDDDVELSLQTLEEFQNWYFKHSWYICREGFYLLDVIFRCKGELIELSWNDKGEFKDDGIEFVNKVGLYYVDKTYFMNVISEFINEVSL